MGCAQLVAWQESQTTGQGVTRPLSSLPPAGTRRSEGSVPTRPPLHGPNLSSRLVPCLWACHEEIPGRHRDERGQQDALARHRATASVAPPQMTWARACNPECRPPTPLTLSSDASRLPRDLPTISVCLVVCLGIHCHVAVGLHGSLQESCVLLSIPRRAFPAGLTSSSRIRAVVWSVASSSALPVAV